MPITYDLEWPIIFLESDGNKDQYYKSVKIEDSPWQDPNTLEFLQGENEKEVIIKAKPRPFVVFSKPTHLKSVNGVNIPEWIKDYIIGFPIRSRKDDEAKGLDYPYMHYIDMLDKAHSDVKDSYIDLYKIAAVKRDLFTTHRGWLKEADFEQVKAKVFQLFNQEKN